MTMLLEDRLYHLDSWHAEEGQAEFSISLLADCDVYRGHFPGHPVCPGVCEMQLLKELVAHAVGSQLTISHIKRCRLTAVATPTACPKLRVEAQISKSGTQVAVVATMADAEKQYMDFKGEMQIR